MKSHDAMTHAFGFGAAERRLSEVGTHFGPVMALRALPRCLT